MVKHVRMSGPVKRLVMVVVGVLALQVQAWAMADSRCEDCGWCSRTSFSCGLCVVEAVGRNCSGWGPGAYAECSGGTWNIYCH